MKRRVALKQILMAAAVGAILPSCVFDKKKKEASVSLKNLPQIPDGDVETLAAVCDTIIPETDLPGAKSLATHLFVLKMVDDCYDKQSQDKFLTGLREFSTLTNERFANAFQSCTQSQREELLTDIDATNTSYSANILTFFKITKQHTIQGFMTSEYVMTKIQGYEFVPGRFNGCLDIAKLKKS